MTDAERELVDSALNLLKRTGQFSEKRYDYNAKKYIETGRTVFRHLSFFTTALNVVLASAMKVREERK